MTDELSTYIHKHSTPDIPLLIKRDRDWNYSPTAITAETKQRLTLYKNGFGGTFDEVINHLLDNTKRPNETLRQAGYRGRGEFKPELTENGNGGS